MEDFVETEFLNNAIKYKENIHTVFYKDITENNKYYHPLLIGLFMLGLILGSLITNIAINIK